MENHHLAATFRLLMLPQYDFMEVGLSCCQVVYVLVQGVIDLT